jgi:hypothetical protein
MSGLRISTLGLGMGVEIVLEVSQGRDWKVVDYRIYAEQGTPPCLGTGLLKRSGGKLIRSKH